MRVVHGHGTAVPGMLRSLKMFGGEELDRCLLSQRRADGIRADLGFGPMRSFDESELIGLAPRGRRTISPQNDSIGIRDDEDERSRIRSPQQHRPHLIDDEPQPRIPSPSLQLGPIGDDPRIRTIRVQPQAQHSIPRAPDQRARLHRGDAPVITAS